MRRDEDSSILETRLRSAVQRNPRPTLPALALACLFPDETTHALESFPVVVGRSPEASLLVDHPSVSRLHARIESHAGSLELLDLRSMNGCALNGQPLPGGGSAPLSPGDVLRLGDVVCRLLAAPERKRFAIETPSLVGGASLDEVRRLVLLLGPTDLRVLVTGKSGTGKELVARELHAHSSRGGPFVAINCAALPEHLVETELFGHVRGAFTGAVRDKPGLFEAASEGTLFLDEVTELPLATQAKLLRVVESGEVRRVGSLGSRQTRCRIVAATNRELALEMERGRFREDLAARLFEAEIQLPTLAERVEDLPPLIRHLSQRSGFTLEPDADVIEALVCYSWPLNVRELDNVLRALSVVAGSRIGLDDLPAQLVARPASSSGRRSARTQMVLEVLRRNNGNIRQTSQELGVSRTFIYGVLKKLGVSPKDIRAGTLPA